MNNSENICFRKEYGCNETTVYHLHMYYAVIYVEKGSLILSSLHMDYKILPGELCIISPLTAHRIIYENADVTYVTFDNNYLRRYISKKALDFMKSRDSDILFVTQPGEAEEVIGKIFANGGQGAYIYILKMFKSAYVPEKNYDNKKKSLTEVIDFIEHNCESKLSLETISQSLSLTKFHICRLIKSAMGITPVEYITFLKIRQAVIRLSSTSYTVKEISEKLSFSSPKYFSNIFKSYLGMSPTDFRKDENELIEKKIFLKR